MAEKPRMATYLGGAMVDNISEALGTEPSRINIKATTTEGLGFVGKGRGGIAAQAIVLITQR